MAAREKSYSPYSKFKVGAALLTIENEIFEGANIESATYTPTNCAERTAFFNAIFAGKRKFIAVAIVGGYENVDDYCYPCGVCRQVMIEFCNPIEFKIIVAKDIKNYEEYILNDLIPHAFGPKYL